MTVLLRRKRAQWLFGTFCSFEASAADEQAAAEALKAGVAELERISALLNPFDPASVVARINRRADGGGWIRIPEALRDVLAASLEAARLTSGRYDPTVWPLLTLWRTAAATQRWPTEAERRSAADAVGVERIELDSPGCRLRLRDVRTQLDLSSAVKGYALDRALQVMRRYPVIELIGNAGGQLLVWHAAGRPVEVGLADPENRSRLLGALQMANGSVATSHQEEADLVIAGTRIGHLFDPRSGVPLRDASAAVVVVAPTGLWADLVSTAAFVSGAERALKVIHAARVEGVLLTRTETGMAWRQTTGFPLIERWKAAGGTRERAGAAFAHVAEDAPGDPAMPGACVGGST